MFYQAENINSALICFVCENKLDDPRLLPCGMSVCNKCVDFLSDTKKRIVKCQHCGKTHEIPQEGFPIILALKNLLEIEAKEVSHSKQMDEFKSLFDSLKLKIKNVESILKTGDAQIRDHCDKVRTSTQLAIEEAHLKLDEIHKEFFNTIDQHESICQEKFKSIQQKKEDIEKVVNESNQFIEEANQLIKQFKIDDTDLKAVLSRTHFILNDLEKIEDKLEIDLYDGCLLKFDKQKFESTSIGTITKQEKDLYFMENLTSIRKLDFEPNESKHLPIICPFKNNTFLILVATNNSLNVICTDRRGSVLYEKKNLIKSEKIEYFLEKDIVISPNGAIYIFSEEKHVGIEICILKISSFDEDFNFNTSIELSNDPTRLWAGNKINLSGENICVLNMRENGLFRTISVYDSNLDFVEKIGQADRTLPFFFSPKIEYLFVSDQYFITVEPTQLHAVEELDDSDPVKIVLLNRATGLVERFFIIKEYFREIVVYLDKYIITYDNDNGFLRSYNLKGDLLKKICLDEELKDSSIYALNKELCFYSEYSNQFSLI